jgi:ubiquinone/menaquinone biosynthesis C-methylase UbiE
VHASFDALINECAVGIADDSQAVLDEMVRVVRVVFPAAHPPHAR